MSKDAVNGDAVNKEDTKAVRAAQFEQLTQTARDSEMGRLLRRFWQPVALSADAAPGKAAPVRVLGEELTLYRGESGRAYLIGGRCSHRRTLLFTGWVDGEELRCVYHGWQYDGRGRNVRRPAEGDEGHPECHVAGYPVHEYCGLVFAWMGEGDAPEFDLPRKPCFEREGGRVAAGRERWDTHWFQQVENSLDATHVSFVHHAHTTGPFGAAVTTLVPKLEYSETDAGIKQIGRRGENNVRESDWTFPNNNHILVPGLAEGDPWIDVGVWVVPMDDRSSMRFILYGIPPADDAAKRRFDEYMAKYAIYDPAAHRDALFRGEDWPEEADSFVGLTAAQDYIAIRGQGPVADRMNEFLGKSDRGIVFLRRLFWRELDAQREGRSTKIWRKRAETVELPRQPGDKTEAFAS